MLLPQVLVLRRLQQVALIKALHKDCLLRSRITTTATNDTATPTDALKHLPKLGNHRECPGRRPQVALTRKAKNQHYPNSFIPFCKLCDQAAHYWAGSVRPHSLVIHAGSVAALPRPAILSIISQRLNTPPVAGRRPQLPRHYTIDRATKLKSGA